MFHTNDAGLLHFKCGQTGDIVFFFFFLVQSGGAGKREASCTASINVCIKVEHTPADWPNPKAYYFDRPPLDPLSTLCSHQHTLSFHNEQLLTLISFWEWTLHIAVLIFYNFKNFRTFQIKDYLTYYTGKNLKISDDCDSWFICCVENLHLRRFRYDEYIHLSKPVKEKLHFLGIQFNVGQRHGLLNSINHQKSKKLESKYHVQWFRFPKQLYLVKRSMSYPFQNWLQAA